MNRRNTIDNLHGNWPIVQYYYTHNNGSSDDILSQRRKLLRIEPTSRQISKKQSDYKNRRSSFPPFDKAVLNCQQNHPIIRTWSTIRKQEMKRKKRETLANLITILSRSNSSATTTNKGGNIFSSYNNNTITAETDLNRKWEAIRQYHPQLDVEKILEKDSDNDETLSQEQRTEMNESSGSGSGSGSGTGSGSSNNSHGQFLPAGQENVTQITSDGIVSIAMHHHTTSALEANMMIPMSNNVNHTDMFLFLFGFLIFPLWWAGTWRFFVQSDKNFLHKQQRAFQIVNCCMTLTSLLIAGLIIGLVTVWA